jgi:metal-responsive CopG/Arc/MetJ family transcriptional regulator
MKKPISATIDAPLIKWLDDVLKQNPIYRNKSHVIEIALQEYKLKIEQDSKKSHQR